MKTLFVNATSCKAGGGLTDLVNTLPRLDARLREDGWQTRVWVVEPGRRVLEEAGYQPDSLTVVDALAPLRRAAWELIGFPRLVRWEKPDVVFHFSNLIFRPLRAPQITVLRSQTFFSDENTITHRTGWYQKLRYRIGCYYSVKTVKWAEGLFCISGAHRADIVRSVGDIGDKVKVSHLGFACPDEALALAGQSRAAIVEQLPEPWREKLRPLAQSERPIVLNVAYYYEHKNLGDLLEAADILSREYPELAVILTSGLTTYQGAMNRQTRHDTELAKQLEAKGILFDLGNVPKNVVWKLLAMADIFAFPSSVESFGHPLLEAMSMGVPVVAGDTPVHREISGDVALFHPVGEPAEIAAHIETIITGQVDRQTLADAGRRQTAGFSWEKHVGDLRDAVLELGATKNHGDNVR